MITGTKVKLYINGKRIHRHGEEYQPLAEFLKTLGLKAEYRYILRNGRCVIKMDKALYSEP